MLKAACLIARKDLRLVLSRGAGLVQALLLGAGAVQLLLRHLRVQLVPGNRGDHERARGCHDLLAVFGVLSGLIL